MHLPCPAMAQCSVLECMHVEPAVICITDEGSLVGAPRKMKCIPHIKVDFDALITNLKTVRANAQPFSRK